jgi:hypothetical protein
MKTNELKKGDRVRLRNGWYATLADNKKGNIRCATVEGYETETGDIYSHDIQVAVKDGQYTIIEHTPAQLALKKNVESFF